MGASTSKDDGSKNFSVDKADYSWKMITNVIIFLIGYYFFLGIFAGFLVILRATDLNNEYLTQNVIIRPIFQFLRACNFFKANFNDISVETFFKSIMIFIYTILFVLLLKDMVKANIYQNLYSTIQLNKNNNPTKNPNMVTKIKDDPTKDIYSYMFKICSGLIFLLAYPFIVLYMIRCYDVQNNILTQVALVSILFVPVFYYITSHLVAMKKVYKTDDIINYGKKYVEEKDYNYIDLIRNKFNFHFDKVLFIPLFMILISILYFFMYYEFNLDNPQMYAYFLALIIMIPLILCVFNYNVLFSCYTPDNECGIFRNGLIKYEVYHEGIKSYYDALIKYNYSCFPR
jgi:hypothetical protein